MTEPVYEDLGSVQPHGVSRPKSAPTSQLQIQPQLIRLYPPERFCVQLHVVPV